MDSGSPARPLLPRTFAALCPLGFASGLPLVLTDSTLKLWIQDAGVPLETIGFFSLVQLPYNLKFLWAPFLDRYVPPLLGRRRGWLVLTQLLLAGALAVLAFGDPAGRLVLVAGLAFGVAFLSASQDIATDAWRTEILPKPLQASGTTTHIAAYRVAILVASAGALGLADRAGWRVTYLAMAVFMPLGPLGTLLAREPEVAGAPRRLREAVVAPFRNFLGRPGALWALLFIAVYKLGDQLATSLAPNFLREIGFSKTAIGGAMKGIGLPALIVGGYAGAWFMRRWSLRRSLLAFGLVQVAAVLVLLVPAATGPRLWALAAAVGLENLGFGMGVAAYMTLIMRLCDLRFTATQFSLLTSLAALPRTLLAAPAGYAAKAYGWTGYFLICAAAALPGLLLLLEYRAWGPSEDA